ncbi:unnamed protein product [Brachionus calyciflorus]|uniref:Uncharacterized protein n=1 Tax=Brachionus calyciflorus TaxID=104777 RepID=A0A814IRG0_9BILA|nr:unnamed protein product [Brachionus calyciflorus]
MENSEGAKRSRSATAANLEKFFISNHLVAIDRNKEILRDLQDLKQKVNLDEKNLASTKNLKKYKVRV